MCDPDDIDFSTLTGTPAHILECLDGGWKCLDQDETFVAGRPSSLTAEAVIRGYRELVGVGDSVFAVSPMWALLRANVCERLVALSALFTVPAPMDDNNDKDGEHHTVLRGQDSSQLEVTVVDQQTLCFADIAGNEARVRVDHVCSLSHHYCFWLQLCT